MKLLLLKTLLQRRARDEGFTLPMVIALGLVMLLLGAVSITIANEENITAITQNSRSDALAIAEVGVTRYRELLDRNRTLAVNDSSQWSTQTQVCNNLTNFLPGATPQNITDTQDRDNDGNTTEPMGSYSLVSYDYSNANGVFNLTNDTANNNARGILTVKGKAPDGSEAQIEAEIPVRINLEDMNTIAPALWIGDSSVSADDLSPLTIGNGNVVIKDQASADGCNGFSALASTTPRRPVISDSRSVPSIQKIIDDVASARTAWTTATGSPINSSPPVTPAPPPPVTTPPTPPGADRMIFGSTTDKGYNLNAVSPDLPTDCSHTKIKLCRYYYDFGSTTSPLTSPLTDTDLLTDGVANTTLLLNQPLSISATNKNVKIGSTSPAANDSNTFEIYVNGNHDITIDVASGRTVNINGFIHAPQSKLTITGSGTVNINGSVWVNDFENNISGSGMVNISPDMITRIPTTNDPSTSGRGYRFYSTTDSRTPRPITGSPTNWKTEEVN